MQDSFGGIDPPRLSVRGSGIQSAPVSRGLLLSFDGFPFSFADGSFNLALVETAWLRYATLTAGPGAGVPALGGALSFWSDSGTFSGDRLVRAGIGSYDTGVFTVHGDTRINDAELAGAGAATRTGGWRLHSEQKRESILASVRRPLTNDRADLTLRLYATRPRFEVPGPLSKTVALVNPRNISPAVTRDRPRRDTEYVQLGGRITVNDSDGHRSFGLAVVHHQDEFRQLLPNGISSSSGEDLNLFGDVRAHWDTARPQYTGLHVLLQVGSRHALRHRNTGGERGALIGDNRLLPYTATIALSHAVALSDAGELELGASAMHARRKINERFVTSENRPSMALNHSDAAVAPRISWSWEPVDAATLYLSWSRSYEPPTFDDLLYTTGPMPERILQSRSLEWQRGESWEGGVQWTSERLTWTAAAHYAPWRNEFLRLADPDGSSRGTVNAGKTLHYGWEISIDLLILKHEAVALRGWATYHRNHVRFDDDPVYKNKRLAGVPPHAGALGLRADMPGGWFVAPGLHWQTGPTWADHDNTLSHGGFGVIRIDFGLAHPSGWEIALACENLFDRSYIASTAGVLDRVPNPETTTLFLPGTPRRVEASIRYTW